MDIEKALEASNPLGRVQMLILIATSLGYIETGFIALSSVFLAEVPPHHCAVTPGYTLNETIPIDEDGVYAKCEEYVNLSVSNETQACSNGWEYDTEVYGESITSEWDLVCSDDYLPDLSQSILLAGFGVGSIMAGPAADRFGRKPTTVVAVVIINVLGIAISYSPNYVVFVSLRFTFGFIYKAVSIPVTTMMYECLLPKHRSTVGNIPPLIQTFGIMLMAVLAALVKDWFYFNIVMISPMFILVLFVWFIPESVRWQISQGKIEEAEKTIQHMAKMNKAKDFPSLVFITAEVIDSKEDVESIVVTQTKTNTKKKGGTMLLFKPPTVIVTFTMGWFMFTFTIVYFGFALTTGSLAGDPYVNFFLSCLVEIPARIIPLFIVRRTGSLKPLLGTLLAAGITMVGIIIVKSTDGSPEWLLTTLSLLGKFFITFAFAPISLLITELFPTTMRNSGTGVAQLIGNIGSLLSPLLLYMDKYVDNLSLIFMTGAAFLSAVLCFCLPETLNTTQPETPADLKVLFETKRIFSFRKSSKKNSIPSESVKSNTRATTYKDNGITNEGFEHDTLKNSQSETLSEVQILSEAKQHNRDKGTLHDCLRPMEASQVELESNLTVIEEDKKHERICKGAGHNDSMSLVKGKSRNDGEVGEHIADGTATKAPVCDKYTLLTDVKVKSRDHPIVEGAKDRGTINESTILFNIMSEENGKVVLKNDSADEGGKEMKALNGASLQNGSIPLEDKDDKMDTNSKPGEDSEKLIENRSRNHHDSISLKDGNVFSKDKEAVQEGTGKALNFEGPSTNGSDVKEERTLELEDERIAEGNEEETKL